MESKLISQKGFLTLEVTMSIAVSMIALAGLLVGGQTFLDLTKQTYDQNESRGFVETLQTVLAGGSTCSATLLRQGEIPINASTGESERLKLLQRTSTYYNGSSGTVFLAKVGRKIGTRSGSRMVRSIYLKADKLPSIGTGTLEGGSIAVTFDAGNQTYTVTDKSGPQIIIIGSNYTSSSGTKYVATPEGFYIDSDTVGLQLTPLIAVAGKEINTQLILMVKTSSAQDPNKNRKTFRLPFFGKIAMSSTKNGKHLFKGCTDFYGSETAVICTGMNGTLKPDGSCDLSAGLRANHATTCEAFGGTYTPDYFDANNIHKPSKCSADQSMVKGVNNAPCNLGSECDSGTCTSSGGMPVQGQPTGTCTGGTDPKIFNQTCATDTDCLSNECSNSLCTDPNLLTYGDTCSSNSQCQTGICKNNYCNLARFNKKGGACYFNTDCSSNVCSAGYCQ